MKIARFDCNRVYKLRLTAFMHKNVSNQVTFFDLYFESLRLSVFALRDAIIKELNWFKFIDKKQLKKKKIIALTIWDANLKS